MKLRHHCEVLLEALIALMHQSLKHNAAMMSQLHSCPSPPPAPQPSLSYQYKPHLPPFPKWDSTPPTTPLLISQITTYKSEAYYAVVLDWMCTTLVSRKLRVAISSNMLASLPSSISSMFLNDARFTSDGIAMLYLLLTHLNTYSRKNLLLNISDLTRLEMRICQFSINYVSRVIGISQRMQGITIDFNIPLFAIARLDHDSYPGMKSRYLTGDSALVNCDLLKLSGLLSSKNKQ